jgi:hypothetical protein
MEDVKDTTLIQCDCCYKMTYSYEIIDFNGNKFDKRYETEHLCKECYERLNNLDKVDAIYDAIRRDIDNVNPNPVWHDIRLEINRPDDSSQGYVDAYIDERKIKGLVNSELIPSLDSAPKVKLEINANNVDVYYNGHIIQRHVNIK